MIQSRTNTAYVEVTVTHSSGKYGLSFSLSLLLTKMSSEKPYVCIAELNFYVVSTNVSPKPELTMGLL